MCEVVKDAIRVSLRDVELAFWHRIPWRHVREIVSKMIIEEWACKMRVRFMWVWLRGYTRHKVKQEACAACSDSSAAPAGKEHDPEYSSDDSDCSEYSGVYYDVVDI